MSIAPSTRRALGSARRRSARSRQLMTGCRYAPRPCRGRLWSSSAVVPRSLRTATTRNRWDWGARVRQPTHVRWGEVGDDGRSATEESTWSARCGARGGLTGVALPQLAIGLAAYGRSTRLATCGCCTRLTTCGCCRYGVLLVGV